LPDVLLGVDHATLLWHRGEQPCIDDLLFDFLVCMGASNRAKPIGLDDTAQVVLAIPTDGASEDGRVQRLTLAWV